MESHIAALRRKLGVDSRAEMISAARSRRGPAVQVPRNSFVGRDADLAAVRERLDRQCWVTVVGAAGSGKTRLALELAAATTERVPYVAELELAGPDDVAAAVARAVGLGPGPDDLVAACGVALGARPALLVLDNCDRVTAAVRPLVARLLALAGDLVVLATCRSPVGGSDEAVHQLAPLPVDGAAVRLFLDRAAVPLTDTDAVARICRRLDGLPLAIELAAARVRHLAPAELADRLEVGFGPLDRAGAPSRHRTLEAAFDWTWDLLDDGERAVLARLAALPGTVDLALAEAVAGPAAGGFVLRLLDRSLLAPAGPPGRFRLLAALRAFVLDRTDPNVVAAVRGAHATACADQAEALARAARTDDSPSAAERAALLLPEATAALSWAVAALDRSATAPEPAGRGAGFVVRLATAVAVLAEQYGPRLDTLDAMGRAARDPRVLATATAADLFLLGEALCYSDVGLVGELAAVALAGATGPAEELAARHLAGYAAAYAHQVRDALEHLDVAAERAARLGDDWHLASINQVRGIALRRTDPPGALAAFAAGLEGYARAGDAMHLNNTRYMMAATCADSGLRTAEAAGWAEQCTTYARESGNRHELAHALLTRAALSAADGPRAGHGDRHVPARRGSALPGPRVPAGGHPAAGAGAAAAAGAGRGRAGGRPRAPGRRAAPAGRGALGDGRPPLGRDRARHAVHAGGRRGGVGPGGAAGRAADLGHGAGRGPGPGGPPPRLTVRRPTEPPAHDRPPASRPVPRMTARRPTEPPA